MIICKPYGLYINIIVVTLLNKMIVTADGIFLCFGGRPRETEGGRREGERREVGGEGRDGRRETGSGRLEGIFGGYF